jgi:hypothetical protein
MLVVLAVPTWAQEPAIGTSQEPAIDMSQLPPATPPPEQTRVGPWTTTGAVELAYRFTSLDGSRTGYRSIVDLPRGLVLGFSRIDLRAPENDAPLFDELTVEAEGGGGEPTSSFRARASKRRLYQVDYRHSRVDTFNFIPDFANPLFADGVLVAPHGWDRRRRLDTLDLTLFSGRSIEVRAGFFRSASSGLGLGTDISDASLVFDRDLGSRSREIKAGVAVRRPRWFLSVETGTRVTTDDEHDTLGLHTDARPGAFFDRRRETDVDAPATRAILTARPFARLDVTARAVYVDYDVAGRLVEASGTGGSNVTTNDVTGLDTGSAVLFDTSQSLRLPADIRVTNYVRYRRYQTTGASDGTTIFGNDPSSATRERDDRRYRDARVEDELRAEVEPFRGLVARAGYRFARRTFDYTRDDRTLLAPPNDPFSTVRLLTRSDEQRADAWLAGLSYRFRHDARFALEMENGREPNPNWGLDARRVFYEKAGDYQLLRMRGAWSIYDWLEVAASFRSLDRSFLSGVIPGRDAIVDDPLAPVFVRLFDGEPPLEQTRSRAASVSVRLDLWDGLRAGGSYERAANTAGITYLQAIESPAAPSGFERVYRFTRYVDDEDHVTADLAYDPVGWATVTGSYSLVSATGTLPVRYHQASLRAFVRFGERVGGYLEWRLYDYDDGRYDAVDFRADHALAGLRLTW